MSCAPSPLVISFYTVDTPYQREVENLISSCHRYGIEYHVEGLTSRGSWILNVAMKPEFICEKMLAFQRPVFWVDADAVFKKKPAWEQFGRYDLAVREMEAHPDDPYLKLAAGSLFFNYNPTMIRFVREWVELCQAKIREDIAHLFYLDQSSLLQMVQRHREINIGALPIAYCKVFDSPTDQIDPDEVVIEHYQASRRFLDCI